MSQESNGKKPKKTQSSHSSNIDDTKSGRGRESGRNDKMHDQTMLVYRIDRSFVFIIIQLLYIY